MKLALLTFGACLATTATAQSDWLTTWDGMLYGYGKHSVLREDSILNPGNRLAHLPERSAVGELRLNLKAESETVRLTARAIATWQNRADSAATQQSDDAYLSQWQFRLRAAEGWHVAAGRDVLSWGPGQFRSPSNPFYFDNGRRNPMRELVGMDSAKISWTPDMQSSASLVHIFNTGHSTSQPDAWRAGWLAKFDRRGNDWTLGLIALKAPDTAAFYGAYGQNTLSDALLLYGELGSSTQPVALQSPADISQPFTVQANSPRRTTALLGAAYTFENSQSLSVEYLHDGHGYTAAQESAYFQRDITQPGIALGQAPRLLGRDYLHLVWQSNLMAETGYWRLMFSRNLNDDGNELAGYGETVLSPKISAYALAVLPQGNARQEFSALVQRSLTLGLKIALP